MQDEALGGAVLSGTEVDLNLGPTLDELQALSNAPVSTRRPEGIGSEERRTSIFGLSLREVAERMGVSFPRISQIEHGAFKKLDAVGVFKDFEDQ